MKFTRIGAQGYVDGLPMTATAIKALADILEREHIEAWRVWSDLCAAEAAVEDARYEQRWGKDRPHYDDHGWRSVVPVAS